MNALLFGNPIKHDLFSDTDSHALLGTSAEPAYVQPRLGGLLVDRYLGTWNTLLHRGAPRVLCSLSALAGGHEVTLTELVAVVLGAAPYIWFTHLLMSGIGARGTGLIMLMALIAVTALFRELYEQAYSPWVAMAGRVTDRTTFGMAWSGPPVRRPQAERCSSSS